MLRRPGERGLAGIAAVLEWLGAVVLGLLFVIVMLAVLRRYLFGAGLIWSDELAIWLNVALVALGMPLAATSALSMRLDVLVRLLPRSGQRLAAILADAVAVHGALVIAIGGASVAALVGGTSTVLGLPESLRFATFAAGGGLTVLLLLWRGALDRSLAAALASLVLGGGLYLAAQSTTGLVLGTPSLVAALAAGLGLLIGAPLPFALLA
ncbi:TRAP transporter small permease, partial [Bosea sp. (in: a-proteobacteria)]|uniref:TRAP transporter small permease n=1 Tax=Bosea sp. (in: a-proteobacteria) TaxID=1871050 RepID=UPI002FCC061B